MRWSWFILLTVLAALLEAGNLLNLVAFGYGQVRPSVLLVLLIFTSLRAEPFEAVRIGDGAQYRLLGAGRLAALSDAGAPECPLFYLSDCGGFGGLADLDGGLTRFGCLKNRTGRSFADAGSAGTGFIYGGSCPGFVAAVRTAVAFPEKTAAGTLFRDTAGPCIKLD